MPVARGHLSGRECPFIVAFLKRKALTDLLEMSGGKRNILYKNFKFHGDRTRFVISNRGFKEAFF